MGVRDSSSYQMYGTRAQLRYALSRVLAVYGDYLLFHYDFAESILLIGGLPSAFDRQAVRVGLTLRTKVIDMGRRE